VPTFVTAWSGLGGVGFLNWASALAFMPLQVVLLPMSQVLGWFNLADSIWGLVIVHVLVGLAMSGVVQIKAWQGKFSAEQHTTVQVYALYWHFVDGVWVFVFSAFILSPHLR